MSETRPAISLVVPVFNEAPNIDELIDRCFKALTEFGRSFEVVAVDDGSSDGSADLLMKHHAADPRLRVVRLVKNFGQTPALYAGMAHTRGDIVALIDADLQNPPEEIPKLVLKLEEGYDVVQGWREDRRDSLFRKIPSRMLNAFISRAIKARVHDLGCGLKVFRRETVERMVLFKHRARYLPADVFWLGAKVGEVKVAHQERRKGSSKYNYLTLFRLCFDIVTGITTAPVRAVSVTGYVLSFLGFFLGVFLGMGQLLGYPAGPVGLISALVIFIAGVQMVSTSIVCQYVSRIYTEVQGRPYFVVKDVVE